MFYSTIINKHTHTCFARLERVRLEESFTRNNYKALWVKEAAKELEMDAKASQSWC